MSTSRRKGHSGGHSEEGKERWLITYADMITLLMVFFIVLYAASTVDVKKFNVIQQNLRVAFNVNVLEGDLPAGIGEEQDMSSLPDYEVGGGPAAAASADFKAIQANLIDFAISQGLEAHVAVEQSNDGVIIRIGGAILFPSGRAELNHESVALLGKIVELVRPLPNELRVEGHTDDIPPSNSPYADNWELSSARAVSVLKAMAAGGISPNRLSATGYADAHPLATNTGATSRARNRRVEILVVYPRGPGAAMPGP